MKHPGYRLRDGLMGIARERHLGVIDDVLAGVNDARRRELLMNHKLLASASELHLQGLYRKGDCLLLINHAGDAWSINEPEEFLEFLILVGYIDRLTEVVSKALSTRPILDAAIVVTGDSSAEDDWPLALQLCSDGDLSEITAEAISELTLFERLRLGTDLPYAVGLRAEAIGARRLGGVSAVGLLHELGVMLDTEDVAQLADIVRPYL